MPDFDVIVVGGGIAGASVGAEIAETRRTLIIEAERQCGFHSTGRSAAFYLESYGGPEVAKLTAASRDFLNVPPAAFSEHGFLRTRGDLHITPGELPELPPGIESRIVEREELERGARNQARVAASAVRTGLCGHRCGRAALGVLAPVPPQGRPSHDQRATSIGEPNRKCMERPTGGWFNPECVRSRERGRCLGRCRRYRLRGRAAQNRTKAKDDGPAARRPIRVAGLALGR